MWNIIFLLIWDVCVPFIAYRWICGYNLVVWQSKIASVFTFITFSTNIKAVRGKNAFWSRTCGGLKSAIIGLSWSNAWESVYISWEYDCYLDVQVRQYYQFCFIYPLSKMIKSPFSSLRTSDHWLTGAGWMSEEEHPSFTQNQLQMRCDLIPRSTLVDSAKRQFCVFST